MARSLAIETSGRVGSIALVDGETILAEEMFQHGLQNAAQILPIIDRLTRRRDGRRATSSRCSCRWGRGRSRDCASA